MLQKLASHKYKLAIFLLLLTSSTIATLLADARAAFGHSDYYSSMVWNLGLAWVPFVFASIAYAVTWSRKLLYLVVPVCALIWLVFFPNAPYILTDLGYLNGNAVSVWYDVLMLLWFALTGLMLSMVSLYLMQEIVAHAFGRIPGWIFSVGIAAVSSLGVCLGRFYRLNTWDILDDPRPIIHDIWEILWHPITNMRVYEFTLVFTLLFLFIYAAIHIFGGMMQEKQLPLKAK